MLSCRFHATTADRTNHHREKSYPSFFSRFERSISFSFPLPLLRSPRFNFSFGTKKEARVYRWQNKAQQVFFFFFFSIPFLYSRRDTSSRVRSFRSWKAAKRLVSVTIGTRTHSRSLSRSKHAVQQVQRWTSVGTDRTATLSSSCPPPGRRRRRRRREGGRRLEIETDRRVSQQVRGGV